MYAVRKQNDMYVCIAMKLNWLTYSIAIFTLSVFMAESTFFSLLNLIADVKKENTEIDAAKNILCESDPMEHLTSLPRKGVMV